MRKSIIFGALALAASGCGGGDTASNTAATGLGGSDNTALAAVAVPDACTFFAKAELETAIGSELREGEAQPVPNQSESSCRFRKQLGRHATKTFPNPALPASVGFSSLTVSAFPADPEAVAEIRQLDPAAFEGMPGLGDDAYFLGPELLHVRVGNRGFSVRIDSDSPAPDAAAKVREVMLALGRAGSARL